jgi:hypothetical protein
MYPGKSSVKAAIYGFGRIGRNALRRNGEEWITADGKQLDRGFASCGNNFGHIGGQIPAMKDCGVKQVVLPIPRHLGPGRGDACFDQHRPGGNRAVVIGAPAQPDIVPCVCASLPPLQNPPVISPHQHTDLQGYWRSLWGY